MQITDATIINVYNYADNPFSLPTHGNPEGYWFEPATNDEPSVFPISFSEIKIANSASQVFREGWLRFDAEVEEYVYKALKINNWEDILSDKEIEKIILLPNKEKLEKLVTITSLSIFDRIRGVLVRLQNAGIYDISQRVVDVINYRYQELYRNKRKSEIVIHKTKQEMIEEVKGDVIAEELEKAKAELEKQIRAEIQAEMQIESKTKKPGRPKKQ